MEQIIKDDIKAVLVHLEKQEKMIADRKNCIDCGKLIDLIDVYKTAVSLLLNEVKNET